MKIETAHQPISVLFEQNPTFEVPKYQRKYAWDLDAIEDFVENIKKCFEDWMVRRERNHYSGAPIGHRAAARCSDSLGLRYPSAECNRRVLYWTYPVSVDGW